MDNQNTNTEVADNMTVEERHEHNKIKRAVSESIMEIIQAAEDSKENKLEEKGIRYLFEILGKTIPIIVIALVSWICLTIVEVQKDIALTQKDVVALRVDIREVGNRLTLHNEDSRQRIKESQSIHHIDGRKCNSCHN